MSRIKSVAFIKTKRSAKAFDKYIETNDTKNLKRQIKNGTVIILGNEPRNKRPDKNN